MFFKIFSSGSRTYKTLSGQEFKQEYNKSKRRVLIDVRTAGEFASGSIPGAKNIDIMSPDFKKQMDRLDKSNDLFVFCRSGSRSAQACRILADLGFNVYNLKGGFGAWPR